MSSSKAEAVPISSSSSSSSTSKSTTNERINNQSILLPDCIRGQRRNQTAMSHSALKERLGTIISTCDIALQSAKYLSESYVSTMFNYFPFYKTQKKKHTELRTNKHSSILI